MHQVNKHETAIPGKNRKGKQTANSVNVEKAQQEYWSVTVGLSTEKAPEYRKVDAQVIVDNVSSNISFMIKNTEP